MSSLLLYFYFNLKSFVDRANLAINTSVSKLIFIHTFFILKPATYALADTRLRRPLKHIKNVESNFPSIINRLTITLILSLIK